MTKEPSVNSVEQPELKITREPAGMRVVRLTVEVPEERMQQQMHRTARAIAQRADIPGFRKGKAPYPVILQRFGEEVIRHEAAEDMTQDIYREALEREDITPYDRGNLENVQMEPLRFTFTVPLMPLVELGDYRSVRLPPPTVEVTPDEVASVLKQLQQDNAILEPAEGRPARAGDSVRITAEGRNDDGEVFLADENAEVVLDPEDDYPAPGFYQAIEGMTVGEKRTFRLKMPDGKPVEEAEFTVELHGVFNRTLPNIDDDLARTVGKFDSLEALKQNIEETIRSQKRRQADEAYNEQVINAVVEQATVEYPPDMIEEELDRIQEQFAERVRRDYRMNLDDFLKVMGKSEQEWRDTMRPRAEERVRRSLVLIRLLAEEGIEASEEEIEQRIARISAAWGDKADKVRAQLAQDRKTVINDILVEKLVARLVTIARGEAAPVETEEKEVA